MCTVSLVTVRYTLFPISLSFKRAGVEFLNIVMTIGFHKKTLYTLFNSSTKWKAIFIYSVTASCAVVRPWESLLIGAIGALISIFAVALMDRLRLDDPVGATAVHGIAGIWVSHFQPHHHHQPTPKCRPPSTFPFTSAKAFRPSWYMAFGTQRRLSVLCDCSAWTNSVSLWLRVSARVLDALRLL